MLIRQDDNLHKHLIFNHTQVWETRNNAKVSICLYDPLKNKAKAKFQCLRRYRKMKTGCLLSPQEQNKKYIYLSVVGNQILCLKRRTALSLSRTTTKYSVLSPERSDNDGAQGNMKTKSLSSQGSQSFWKDKMSAHKDTVSYIRQSDS